MDQIHYFRYFTTSVVLFFVFLSHSHMPLPISILIQSNDAVSHSNRVYRIIRYTQNRQRIVLYVPNWIYYSFSFIWSVILLWIRAQGMTNRPVFLIDEWLGWVVALKSMPISFSFEKKLMINLTINFAFFWSFVWIKRFWWNFFCSTLQFQQIKR